MNGKRRRHIRRIIEKKVEDWLKSIDDESLRSDLETGVIVTGGSIASMLLGEPVNDYDLYLNSLDLAAKVARYYVAKFQEARKDNQPNLRVQVEGDRVFVLVQSAGVVAAEGNEEGYQYFEQQADPEATEAFDYVQDVMESVVEDAESQKQKPSYRPLFVTSNAISLSDKVQLVTRFHGSPDEVHENFDYVHCTSYWTKEDGLVLTPEAMESLLSRYLVYRGSLYPVCSLFRLRKFLGRGWRGPSAGDIVKMAWQCSELDLSDPMILREQMIGVDTWYFFEVLKKLRESGHDTVQQAYLFDVLDEIFN